MRPSHIAVLVVLSVIWGSAFALVKVALEEVPPLTLVAGRLAGAALFLAAVLLVTGRSLPRRREVWLVFGALAVANNLWPFTLLTWGQQHIDSSLAAILVASMPLFTVLIAWVWIDERLTLDRAAGVLVGFAGVFVLFGGSLSDVTDSSTLGQLAMVGGGLAYAVGAVLARRYVPSGEGAVFAAGQTMVAAVVMAPVALAADRPFDISVSAKTALAWITLGVLASGIAYLLYFWLIARVTATQASMVTYLIPITAVLVGAFVLDERLGATTVAGLPLIVSGVWLVSGGGAWLASRNSGT